MHIASIKSALAKYAQVSMLGSLGRGTFVETPNFAVATNGAPIVAAQSNLFEIGGFTAKVTGRILCIAIMTNVVSAAGDQVVYNTTVDGTPTPGGTGGGSQGTISAGAAPIQSDGTVVWIQSVLVGGIHSYGILATNSTGGHTVATGTGAATVALYELP